MRPASAKSNPALLVHGECASCDWMMAATEGSKWPLCPECGGFVFPAPIREDREAYVAVRLPERQAVEIVVMGRPSYVRELSELALAASPLIDGRFGPKYRRRYRKNFVKRFVEARDAAMEIVRNI